MLSPDHRLWCKDRDTSDSVVLPACEGVSRRVSREVAPGPESEVSPPGEGENGEGRTSVPKASPVMQTAINVNPSSVQTPVSFYTTDKLISWAGEFILG